MSANISHLVATKPRTQPCKPCQQRRVKCDRRPAVDEACSNCIRTGVGSDCVVVSGGRKKAGARVAGGDVVNDRVGEVTRGRKGIGDGGGTSGLGNEHTKEVEDLRIKVNRYENALKELDIDVEAIAKGEGVNRKLKASGGCERCARLDPERSQKATERGRERSPYLEKTNGTGLTDQFQDGEEILESSVPSSENVILKNPIMRTFDELFDNSASSIRKLHYAPSPSSNSDCTEASSPTSCADNPRIADSNIMGLLFDQSGAALSTSRFQPLPLHTFHLWQIYLSRVHPLAMVVHAPTTQQKLLSILPTNDSSQHVESASFRALVWSIYYAASTTLLPGESERLFGEEKDLLVEKFESGVLRSFGEASLLKSYDLETLSAFVVFLSASVMNIDPRSMYVLLGIAVRIAHRMGIDGDARADTSGPDTTSKLSVFEKEMRRRTWWRIVCIDIHVAELSGGGSPILNQAWSTTMPLDVNDSELYPEMKEPPRMTSAAGRTTESVCCMVQYEIASYLHGLQQSDYSRKTSEKLEQLEARIERKYLANLQPSLQFHNLTMLMARCMLSKTYITLNHNRYFPKSGLSQTQAPTPHETVIFFKHILTHISAYNNLLALSDLGVLNSEEFDIQAAWFKKKEFRRSPYHWYAQKNYPFAAHILIPLLLRSPMFSSSTMPNDIYELVQKAWVVLNQSFFLRRLGGGRLSKDAPISVALAGLTFKAWETREIELRKVGVQPLVPGFVKVMRVESNARAYLQRKGFGAAYNDTPNNHVDKPADCESQETIEVGTMNGPFDLVYDGVKSGYNFFEASSTCIGDIPAHSGLWEELMSFDA